MLGGNNMLKYSVWKSQHFEWTEEILLDSKGPFGKPPLLEIPGSAELLFARSNILIYCSVRSGSGVVEPEGLRTGLKPKFILFLAENGE